MRSKKQINIEIGERIKKAREKKNLTQEMLAEVIDVSTQYISDLERGVVGASLSTIKAICVALEITSDSLLFGEIPEGAKQNGLLRLCEGLTDGQIDAITEIIKIFVREIKKASKTDSTSSAE